MDLTVQAFSRSLSVRKTSVAVFYLYCFFFFLQKSTKLKKMLLSKDLEFIMEAHNGLSAKIVEEAGAYTVLFC